MNIFQRASLLTICLLFSSSGLAQMGLEGFSSGRYVIKNRGPASDQSVVTDSDGVVVKLEKDNAPIVEDEAVAPKELPVKKPVVKKTEEQPVNGEALTPVIATKEAMSAVSPPQMEKAPEEAEEPSIGDQAQSLFTEGAGRIYEFYRDQVDEDDIRRNRLEIEVSPTAVYNDSQSNYSFRDYQSFFNALKIRSNVWVTPLIGVSGQILFSFAADMDSLSGDSRVSAKYEFLDLGLNFRRFFGVDRLSNSLEFSIILSDNKTNVPSDNTSRARVKSSGLGVGMKGRFPTSLHYAWVVGGTFFPRLQHTESETGAAINSGSMAESTRMGLDLGGEWKFDRGSQLIWNLGLQSERNVFDGAAGIPDPSTGSTPENVSVTNSYYMFSLGYRWGH